MGFTSAIRNCLVRAKAIDYFKFQPAPKFIGGEERSALGVLGTLLLLAIMLGYMANSTTRFFTAPPATTILQTPTSTLEKRQFLPTCVSTPHLNDLRYFGWSFHWISLDDNGDKIPGAERPVPITVHGDDKICLNLTGDANTTYLQAPCNPKCNFLKFKLFTCGTPDDKNPAHPHDKSACAGEPGQPTPSAENILTKNYVRIRSNYSGGSTLLNAAPKVQYSSFYELKFAVNETQQSPDFLRWWTNNNIFQLKPTTTRYALQYAYDNATPFAEVLEVQFALDANRFVTVQTRQTVLDLIGSFGAFFGVISAALAAIFATYNQRAFYERVPRWAAIDDNFVVEQGSRKVVDNETQNLLSSKNLAQNAARAEGAYGDLA